ncbi:hypothetical protein [Streptomyces sp. RKAG337]|uniref:hypothetical protein n=1 Tax=Streptomyces sp. RKAG337 TaxID=2893404 RepID=UPI002033F8C9|nr:hypothetical protein [Streptomyces sp. RKAG337]MCM2427547.1 hypothetical protein [Streptomyces sp. RKAG337]
MREGVEAELATFAEKGLPLRRAMITTQGCDLLKRTHTWISVAPVYDAAEYFDKGKLGQIRAGYILHLLPLAPPWGETGQKWVADLRIEIPVEKTVLIGHTPLESYANEGDYIRVPQRLAHLRQRPDVAEDCLTHVSQPLFDWVNQQEEAAQERMCASVDHVRIWQDRYDAPTRAQIILIMREGLEEAHDQELWDQAHNHIYEHASRIGLLVLPTKCATLKNLSASEFQGSHMVADGNSS